MSRGTLALTLGGMLLSLAALAATDLDRLQDRLERAARTYSLQEARALLEEQQVEVGERPAAARLLYVRSLLLVAELLRIEWEELADSQRSQRRQMGREIDSYARRGLVEVEMLDESSERSRLRADLYSTMIRTDFQAKKYRKKMEAATEAALELDPDNAHAHVTAAKPLIFAKQRQGGDPQQALALLDRALELQPDLEPARLLRAVAWDKLGAPDRARADWQQALDNNPHCLPAQRALDTRELPERGNP
jgi:tetratricopeptide (TPR) repeat protein